MSDVLADSSPQHKSTIYVFLCGIFFISGFSGLIYESLWSHYLKLFLGSAAEAQSVVLVIFMGGMALGAWLVSRLTHRPHSPLVWYALIELCLGLCALLFHLLFGLVDYLLFNGLMSILPASTISLTKYIFAAGLLFLPCVLLGMTFPLMASVLTRVFPARNGAVIATIYAVNSLGGALGVLVSGFYFVGTFGLQLSLVFAGFLNLLIAGVAWKISSGFNHGLMFKHPSATANLSHLSISSKLLFVCAFVTGLASFMYEVAWVRMLSMVLGSSNHAFELMLSAFILGLAAGGWVLKGRIDKLHSIGVVLGIVQIIMAVLAVVSIAVYNQMFDFFAWGMSAVSRSSGGYGLFNIISHATAVMVMVPVAFCAGMTLPLITTALMAERQDKAVIGKVYALNTVGAIVGVLLASHVVMPTLGVKNVVLIGAAFDCAIGVLLIVFYLHSTAARMLTGGAVLCLILFGAIVRLDENNMAIGVYRFGDLFDAGKQRLLFHKDGKVATVSVVDYAVEGTRSIITNGKADAAIKLNGFSPDEVTMTLLGGISSLYKPDAKRVAVIGFGSGMSTHTALGNAKTAVVDTVEIEPVMVQGARLFGDKVKRAFDDPRSHIHIADARTFFETQKVPYDVIVSEPSNPWVGGVANLFTEEFYGKVANRYLANDGVFVQWLQIYEINIELVATVVKALEKNFSDYEIYGSSPGDLVIVAKKKGSLSMASINTLDSELLKAFTMIGIKNDATVRYLKLGNRQDFSGMFATYSLPANSDFHPVLDHGAVKSRFLGENASNIQALRLFKYGASYSGAGLIDSEIPLPYDNLREAANLIAYLTTKDSAKLDALPLSKRKDTLIYESVPGCAAPNKHFTEAFVRLFFELVTFVSPDQLEQLMQKVTIDCKDQSAATWKRLFSAMSRADYGSIAVESQSLLKDPNRLEWERFFLIVVLADVFVQQGDVVNAKVLLLAVSDKDRNDPRWRYLYGKLSSPGKK